MEHSQYRLPSAFQSSAGLGAQISRCLPHTMRAPRLSLFSFLAWLAIVPSALAQGNPATQRTPVFVWGIQEGCKLKTDLTAQVMDRLAKEHSYRVEPLLTASGSAPPACPGPVFGGNLGCSKALKQQCPGKEGLVLGGVVDRQDKATRIRLWLYDLQTDQLAVQDDYCQQCDPDDSKVLTSHAVALLSAPVYGTTPPSQPSFCQSAPAKVSATIKTAGSLHLGIFGNGLAREEVRKELLRRIGLKRAAQQQTAPMITEQPGADPNSFERITKGQDGAQVLRIEVGAISTELSLWDQRSRRVATRSVSCGSGCRESLEAISQAAAEIMDVCFSDLCSLMQPIDHRPPDACLELSKQDCPALPSTTDSGARGGIDRGLANRLEVLTGVGLGLSAATTIGLLIANETVTLTRTVGFTENGSLETKHVTASFGQNFLVSSRLAMGLTAGLAVLSIPIFYSLEKAKRITRVGPDLTTIRCPAPIIGLPSAGLPRRSRL